MENNKEEKKKEKSVADIFGEVVDYVNDPNNKDVSDYYNRKGSGGYTGD